MRPDPGFLQVVGSARPGVPLLDAPQLNQQMDHLGKELRRLPQGKQQLPTSFLPRCDSPAHWVNLQLHMAHTRMCSWQTESKVPIGTGHQIWVVWQLEFDSNSAGDVVMVPPYLSSDVYHRPGRTRWERERTPPASCRPWGAPQVSSLDGSFQAEQRAHITTAEVASLEACAMGSAQSCCDKCTWPLIHLCVCHAGIVPSRNLEAAAIALTLHRTAAQHVASGSERQRIMQRQASKMNAAVSRAAVTSAEAQHEAATHLEDLQRQQAQRAGREVRLRDAAQQGQAHRPDAADGTAAGYGHRGSSEAGSQPADSCSRSAWLAATCSVPPAPRLPAAVRVLAAAAHLDRPG